MIYRSIASAPITAGNQPAYDVGGCIFHIEKILSGSLFEWETLSDTVEIQVDTDILGREIRIENNIQENVDIVLPIEAEANTAGRVILSLLQKISERGGDFPYRISLKITKGISICGTGLGSSGASSAACLRACVQLFEHMGISLLLSDQEICEILTDADFGVPDNAVAAYFRRLTVFASDGIIFPEILPSPDTTLLVIPRGFAIKTHEARAALSGLQAPDQTQEIQQALDALAIGNMALYGSLLMKLHHWFALPRKHLYPQDGRLFDEISEVAMNSGATAVIVSGAGPSLIVTLPKDISAKDIAEKIRYQIQACSYDAVVLQVQIR